MFEGTQLAKQQLILSLQASLFICGLLLISGSATALPSLFLGCCKLLLQLLDATLLTAEVFRFLLSCSVQILDDIVGLAQVASELFNSGNLFAVPSLQLFDSPLERLNLFSTVEFSGRLACETFEVGLQLVAAQLFLFVSYLQFAEITIKHLTLIMFYF